MCFSLAASLVAGAVGMSAAAVLRGGLGLFVAWYTLVQFGEAALYAGGSPTTWNTVLVLLLSSQLAVFTAATWTPTPLYHALAVGGVAVFVAAAVSHKPRVPVGDFALTRSTSAVLVAQYVGIFAGMLSQPHLRGAAAVLGGTCVLAAATRDRFAPSLWCWLSAVAAPLMLFV